MNSVILQACSNATNLHNRLRNILLNLWNLFVAESIFKMVSLNLFGAEPTFHGNNMLNF